MKRVLVMLLLAVCLSGCAAPPAADAEGISWSEDWVNVGNVMGVDTPDGLTPRENNDTLAARGMYYAAWSIGEGESYVNADGEDAEIYDAQIYLLLAGFSEVEKAEESATAWKSMAGERYLVEQELDENRGGVDFDVLTYEFISETNPYARGASAFGVYRNYAVSVELSCRESFSGDPLEVLTRFLESCHYAA